MLVDIALANREAPLVMPGDKGGLVMTIDDRVIRRAYCDLVFREIEQSRAIAKSPAASGQFNPRRVSHE